MDVVYFDFKKAFDSVPHQRLLLKLKSYGIEGRLLDLNANFLTNRKQRMNITLTGLMSLLASSGISTMPNFIFSIY